MNKNSNPQSEAERIAGVEEALRLQELDTAEQVEEIEDMKLEIEQLRKEKQELEAKAQLANPSSLEDTQFLLDGNRYRFVYPALTVDKQRLTAFEMLDRVDILQNLVRNGSAAIKLIDELKSEQ